MRTRPVSDVKPASEFSTAQATPESENSGALSRPKNARVAGQSMTPELAKALRDAAVAKAEDVYRRRLEQCEKEAREQQPIAFERIAASRQRALDALAMRRGGKTLSEIGARYGVGRERARQLVLQGEREEQHREKARAQYGATIHDLSVRAQMTLLNFFWSIAPPGSRVVLDDIMAEWVSAIDFVQFRRTPNVGPKTVVEVQNWLKLASVGTH